MTTPGSQAGPTAADPDYRSAATRRPATGYDYEADLPPGWPGTAPEGDRDTRDRDNGEPADLFPGPSQAAPDAVGTDTGLEAAEETAASEAAGPEAAGLETAGPAG